MATLRPDVPEDFETNERDDFDLAWDAMLSGDLDNSSKLLARLERRHPNIAALLAIKGFIELRTGSTQKAESIFLAAASSDPGLAAPHGGGFLVALALEDDDAAYRYIRALQSTQADHVLVARHLVRLQLTIAEKHLALARRLKNAESYGESLESYQRALDVAPEAGALYVEAASVALSAERSEMATDLSRKAVELEPENVAALRSLGDALEADDDLQSAIDVYQKASALNPEDEDLRRRLNSLQADYERNNLPAEYAGIAETDQITREELAAILFVSLREGFEEMPGGMNVIATDITDSWAVHFIRRVVSREILEVFPNHTFQPKAFVRRLELARALNAAFRALDEDLFSQAQRTEELAFSDLTIENLNHPAASLVVASGLMELGDEQAFEPNRLVSGDEAIKAVAALARLLQS